MQWYQLHHSNTKTDKVFFIKNCFGFVILEKEDKSVLNIWYFLIQWKQTFLITEKLSYAHKQKTINLGG